MDEMVKANFYSEEYVKSLKCALYLILDDATADLDIPNKRLWPIRAANYRLAKKALDSDTAKKRRDQARALADYLEMLLDTHEIVPADIVDAINDRIELIKKGAA